MPAAWGVAKVVAEIAAVCAVALAVMGAGAATALAFAPSNKNGCAKQALAAAGMGPAPFTLAGQVNSLPPVASWQTLKSRYWPATALLSVELVTLPVSVIDWKLPFDASNVGVAENVTAFCAVENPPLTASALAGVVVPIPTLPAPVSNA